MRWRLGADRPQGGRDDRLGEPPAGRRGRGIALGIKSGPTTGLSYSTVRLLSDGSVIVFAGTSDMGQGARTVFAQIAATELGLPLSHITVVSGDTAIVPYDQQTSASRSTVLMGNAVLSACREIQAQLRAMAARVHGISAEGITVEGGRVHLPIVRSRSSTCCGPASAGWAAS